MEVINWHTWCKPDSCEKTFFKGMGGQLVYPMALMHWSDKAKTVVRMDGKPGFI